MADVGVADQPPVPEGMRVYQGLIDGGVSAQEANQWKADMTGKMLSGGVAPAEIDKYWGESAPNPAQIDKLHTQNLAAIPAGKVEQANDDPLHMLAAGWNMSDIGLAVAGKAPNPAQATNILGKIAYSTGQLAGDFPVSVLGFLGGGAAGAAGGGALGTVTVPGLGTVGGAATGAVVGAGAGAAALPQAVREVLLDYYKRGEVHNFSDFMSVAGGSLMNTGKAALAGALAGKLGEVAEGVTAPVVGNTIAKGANAVTQATTFATVGAGLEGHVPDADDFVTGAVMALGFHAAGAAVGSVPWREAALRVQSNLQNIYRQTGVPPWEAATRARTDPVFRQEIFAQDVNGDPVTPTVKQDAPAEPAPYQQQPEPAPAAPAAAESPEAKAERKQTLQDIDDLTRQNDLAKQNRAASTDPREQAAYDRLLAGQEERLQGLRERASQQQADFERGNGGAFAPAKPGEPIPPEQVAPRSGAEMLPLVRALEGSGDQAVSPAGAIGRYQIMPGTARQYGFDPARLTDPAYNEQAAATILNDLHRRYQGNQADILVAYNAGPGTANKWIAGGRDFTTLPAETQRYLERAGMVDKGHQFGLNLPEPKPAEPPQESPGVHLTEDELNAKFNAQIGEEPAAKDANTLATFWRQWVSELQPLRAIDTALVKGGMDRDTQLGLEDLGRQTYASDSRAGYFVRYGTLDGTTLNKTSDDSLFGAMRAVKEDGGDAEGFRNYMLAHRAIDLNVRGLESGFDPENARDLIEAGGAKYERARQIMNRVTEAALRYGQARGVFSAEQVEAMLRENPTYISMRRIMGEEGAERVPKPGKGRSLLKVAPPVRRYVGDDGKIIDPMLATIDNINQIVRMADRNQVAKAVVEAASRPEVVEAGLDSTKVQDGVDAPGADKALSPYQVKDQTAFDPLLAVRATRKGAKENQFLYLNEGKPELWEAKDPDLAAAVRGADSPGQVDIVTRVFQKLAQLARTGVVSAVDFPFRITARHQPTAFILDPHSPVPGVTWLKGVWDAFGAGDAYQDFLAKGGAGATISDMDRDVLARDMSKIFEETGTWDKMWNTVRHPLEAVQLLHERIDASARVGYKKTLEERGIDPIKAATESRTAMIDFAEKGTLGFAQYWSRIVPFFRPHLLGLKQAGEALTGNPVGTLGKIGLAVVLPQAVLYAMNTMQDEYGDLPEDQKYRNIPRYFRDGMYIFPKIGGFRLRMPLPFVVGTPFGSLTTRFLDHFWQHDPAAFKDWSQTLLAEVIPPFLPSIALPPLQAVTNHNFFTGKPLIPASLEENSGPMQYTENTTEPAKALAKVLPQMGPLHFNSPIALENYVQGWTGSVGMAALHALNATWKDGGKPWEVADIPFVQSFTIRNPGSSAQPIQDFYEMRKEFKTAQADKALAIQRLRAGVPGAEGELDTAAKNLLPSATLDRVAAAIKMQQTVLEATFHNKEMTTDEKRQAIDQLYSNMIEMSKAGLEVGKALKEQQ